MIYTALENITYKRKRKQKLQNNTVSRSTKLLQLIGTALTQTRGRAFQTLGRVFSFLLNHKARPSVSKARLSVSKARPQVLKEMLGRVL